MVKQVEVIEEGNENVVEVLRENIAKIEAAEQEEIDIAVQPIKEKYGARLCRYKQELDRYVHTEEVEVEDEDEVEPETETVENSDSVNVDYEKEYIGE